MQGPMTVAELLARKPTRITDEELEEIRRRCDRATPGSWIAAIESPVWGTIGGPVCYMDEDNRIVVGTPGDWGPTNDPADDAEFIAYARTDVPRLLDEVIQLRAERDAARAAVPSR